MLAMIDKAIQAQDSLCVMTHESSTVIKAEFKHRLHRLEEDRKYFANTFDPVMHIKTAVGESYFLSLLLVELMKEDSGIEWVEAKPFTLRICHTQAVNALEIAGRIEKAEQQLRLADVARRLDEQATRES